MNSLALMWLKRQIDKKDIADLRKLSDDFRKMRLEYEPLRRATKKAREENMRMEGDHGFVMVQR